MVKGQDEKLYEEWLRALGMLSLEETEVRPHLSLQHPHEAQQRGRYQSLHSCDQ